MSVHHISFPFHGYTMKNHTILGLAPLLAALACPIASPAQSPASPESNPPPGSEPAPNSPGWKNAVRVQPTSGAMVSLDFPGGTVAQFASALKSALASSGGAVNIIFPTDAMNVEVPPISLQGVRPATAMAALVTAFRSSEEHRFDFDTLSGEFEVPSFAISYKRIKNPASAQGAEARATLKRRVEVFSVREILEAPLGTNPSKEHSDEARNRILIAIDDALAAAAKGAATDSSAQAPQPAPATVLLNSETSLLIINGDDAQIDIARAILSHLRNDTIDRRKAEQQQIEKASARWHRIEAAKIQLDSSRAELDVSRGRLEKSIAEHQAGQLPSSHLDDARLKLIRAETNVKQAELELMAAENDPAFQQLPAPARSDTQARSVVVYKLAHAPAAEVLTVVAAFVNALHAPNDLGDASRAASVASDTRNNSIIVSAGSDTHQLVRLAVDTIDRIASQSPGSPPAKPK